MMLTGPVHIMHPDDYELALRRAVAVGYLAGTQDTMRSFGRAWRHSLLIPSWCWERPGLLVSAVLAVVLL